jgi:HPt (histidine-containing phosphotransfer) domain-containing protein
VNQLGKHLKALDTQWELQNLEALAVTLRWVCQHAELFGIRDILLQANQLLEVVEAEAFGLVPAKLRYIKRLYARIEGRKAVLANDSSTQADVDVADKIPVGRDSGKPNRSRALANQLDASVRSSLNVSNPTIQRLVKRSVTRLHDLLAKMELCYQSEDLKELVKLCYRLRGEADIAGLKAFISPARQLEHYVNTGQLNRVENQLQQLRGLLAGIEMPESVTTGLHPEPSEMTNDIEQETVDMEKINSTLNLSNPKLKLRVQQFVVRLGSQLTELSEATEQKDFDELTRISKWIVNYSPVMGFDMLSQPAQGLVDAVEIRDDQEIVNRVEQLRILFSRIEI